MKKRVLVAATVIAAIVVFGVAALMYEKKEPMVANTVPRPAADSSKNTETKTVKNQSAPKPATPARSNSAASRPPQADATADGAERNDISVKADYLVRPHSPILGLKDAPVTIVEFFDPACEACRAFHPYLKAIMNRYNKSVRVVVRYAAFHKGSDEAVRILETARLQGVYKPVLESLLKAQPNWASHGNPDIEKAWEAAAAGGLDVGRARKEKDLPGITTILTQDMEDIKFLGVRQTPTFFVNGKPLPKFHPQELANLVHSEVQATKNR